MGAKSTLKLRNRGVAFKCNLCGRKLMSSEALVGHQRTAHNVITKRRGKPPPSLKPVKSDKKHLTQVTKQVTASPSVRKHTKDSSFIKMSKVEFECPECFKTFPTYFTALKHIQKNHDGKRRSITTSPEQASPIRPQRIELCTNCMCKVVSLETHVCISTNNMDDPSKLYVCAACEEWFPKLKAFECHVVNIHREHIESMFFPTSIEFTKWKTEMEQQMNISYATMDKYESKRYYHCSYVKDGRDKPTTNYICPSTIIAQDFPKGIQVHFYHKHHQHCPTEYKLSQKYKKYSISSFLRRSDDYNNLVHLKHDDDDLYMQFKTLMEGIIVDAAKINIATLKIILGKALEITSILTNYDEELDDISTVSLKPKRVMSDVDITKALEEPLAKRKATEANVTVEGSSPDVQAAKRKNTNVSTSIPEVKRPKADNEEITSPKIVNSFSLAEPVKPKKVAKENNNKESDVEDDNEKDSKANGEDTPPSFNDSYKDFVVRNFPSVESVASRTRSKPVVKTRIGQYKPQSTKTDEKPKVPKVAEDISSVPTKVAEDKPKLPPMPRLTKITEETPKLLATREIKVEDKPKVASTVTKFVEDKTKAVTDSKDGDEKTEIGPKTVYKVTPKTKFGRTQSVKRVDTPKAKTISRNYSVNSRFSFDKPKVDFEYEVKEQVDDCNILILKM